MRKKKTAQLAFAPTSLDDFYKKAISSPTVITSIFSALYDRSKGVNVLTSVHPGEEADVIVSSASEGIRVRVTMSASKVSSIERMRRNLMEKLASVAPPYRPVDPESVPEQSEEVKAERERIQSEIEELTEILEKDSISKAFIVSDSQLHDWCAFVAAGVTLTEE